jgi:hypothetical protein
MESPGERYSLLVFGFCSPPEVKTELEVQIWRMSPVESPKMLALCNLPKAAEANTEVTSNRFESWI